MARRVRAAGAGAQHVQSEPLLQLMSEMAALLQRARWWPVQLGDDRPDDHHH
jgi:hypothetical protein